MDASIVANPTSAVSPGQIVYLDCRQTRLYAEVIQVIDTRHMGWIRPLALVLKSGAVQILTELNLQSDYAAPDVVWPLNQIQIALDTEAIPILAMLSAKETEEPTGVTPDQPSVADFVRWLWADSHPPIQG